MNSYSLDDLQRIYGETLKQIRSQYPKGCCCAIGQWAVEAGDETSLIVRYAVRQPETGWEEGKECRVKL